MKFTYRDRRDTVLWGFGGFVAGITYQIINIWVKQRTNIQDLNPTTEALCEDPTLFSLFCQLQEYRDIDEKSFRRSVDDADRLVFLHRQLSSKKLGPSISDRPTAFLHFKNAIRHLEQFMTKSQSAPHARTPVEVHRLYSLLFEALEGHWNSVLHMTQDVTNSDTLP